MLNASFRDQKARESQLDPAQQSQAASQPYPVASLSEKPLRILVRDPLFLPFAMTVLFCSLVSPVRVTDCQFLTRRDSGC
jgi:hypothetical protein